MRIALRLLCDGWHCKSKRLIGFGLAGLVGLK